MLLGPEQALAPVREPDTFAVGAWDKLTKTEGTFKLQRFSSRQSTPFKSYIITPQSSSASEHIWGRFKIRSSPTHPVVVGPPELRTCYFGSAYLDTMPQTSFRRLDDHRSFGTLPLSIRDGEKRRF